MQHAMHAHQQRAWQRSTNGHACMLACMQCMRAGFPRPRSPSCLSCTGVWGVIAAATSEYNTRQATALTSANEKALNVRTVIVGAFNPCITVAMLIRCARGASLKLFTAEFLGSKQLHGLRGR